MVVQYTDFCRLTCDTCFFIDCEGVVLLIIQKLGLPKSVTDTLCRISTLDSVQTERQEKRRLSEFVKRGSGNVVICHPLSHKAQRHPKK